MIWFYDESIIMRPEIDEPSKTFTYDPETGDLWRLRSRVKGHGGKPIVLTPTNLTSVNVNFHCNRKRSHLCWAPHHGLWPHEGMVIDHINGNPSDDRITNLREWDQSQNAVNLRRSVLNTSGYKEVCREKRRGKWRTLTQHQGRNYHLGYFDDPKEAHEAHCAKARELHGEFFNAG